MNSASLQLIQDKKKQIKNKKKNQNWKTENINRLLRNVPTENITQNKKNLIYVGAKLVSDKIGISPRKPDRNTKAGWEKFGKGQIKKLKEQDKVPRKDTME